jgi:hypothetical protein
MISTGLLLLLLLLLILFSLSLSLSLSGSMRVCVLFCGGGGCATAVRVNCPATAATYALAMSVNGERRREMASLLTHATGYSDESLFVACLPACLATTYYLLTYGCYPVGSRYLSRQAGRQAGTAV